MPINLLKIYWRLALVDEIRKKMPYYYIVVSTISKPSIYWTNRWWGMIGNGAYGGLRWDCFAMIVTVTDNSVTDVPCPMFLKCHVEVR